MCTATVLANHRCRVWTFGTSGQLAVRWWPAINDDGRALRVVRHYPTIAAHRVGHRDPAAC